MKMSFLTLGCPEWDLDTICRKGAEYGFQGVDFRGYLETVDITLQPMFKTQARVIRQRFADAGLAVSGISSSITVCDMQRAEQNLEEARRLIGVAQELGCQNIRIFGGGDLSQSSRQELARVGCETIETILALDGAINLHWLFETHDLWVRAADCRLLLDQIPQAAFGVLWDVGHTSRVGGETPGQSYAAVGSRLGYTHIKDAVYEPEHPQAMIDGWRYVLPGSGELPLQETVQLLQAQGYTGWYVFEHEKRWHPELADPQIAFPAFVQWIKNNV